MEAKQYTICGKEFYQKPLGNLQAVEVEEIVGFALAESTTPVTNAMTLYKALGKRRPDLWARVLIPKGMTDREFVDVLNLPGALEETIDMLAWECPYRTGLEVTRDFLTFNDIFSCFQILEGMQQTLTETVSHPEPSSNGSAPPSPEATQLVEMPSSH